MIFEDFFLTEDFQRNQKFCILLIIVLRPINDKNSTNRIIAKKNI